MVYALNRLFCMELATAGVVIGVLGVISCILETTETSIAIANFTESTSNNTPGNDKNSQQESLTWLVTQLVGALVDLLASALLIIGTLKKQHLMLLPWLVCKAIVVGGLILGSIFCFFFGIYHAFVGGTIAIFLASFILIAVTVLLGYVWLGIYSLYQNIRADRNRPIPIGDQIQYPGIPHTQFT